MSIFTLGEVNVALFPATSVTVTLPVTEEPSEVNERGLCIEVEAKPDNASVAVKGTDTFVLFQPAAFAGGAAAPKASVGAVLSILMPLAVAWALTLPALSVQVPEAD